MSAVSENDQNQKCGARQVREVVLTIIEADIGLLKLKQKPNWSEALPKIINVKQ